VNPDQQVRAAAAQATASLMCTVPPPPADFIAMAEVVEAYIRDGKAAAFALCPGTQEAPLAPPAVAATPLVQPEPVAPASADAPPEGVQEEQVPERDADVIPLAARGTVSAKQEGARRIIEKHRKERVDSLISQASVAKAKAHKQRILDDAEENDLMDYMIVVKGEPTTVRAYLGSLLGS
jgi:hypothetical protein